MTFLELNELIVNSGRRSIASALIAILVDEIDAGNSGVELDLFLERTQFIRNNTTKIARYLQSEGILTILYYREGEGTERQFHADNIFGRWSKQYYMLTPVIRSLFKRT